MHNNLNNSITGIPRAKKRATIIHESLEIENEDKSISKTPYSYGCALLPLNEDSVILMRYWAKKHVPKNVLYINEDEGIDGYEAEPHVTVKYGLHDDDPIPLIDLIGGIGNIPLKFGNITKFDSHPDYDVLKIDVKGDKLMMLNKMISSSLDNTDTHPDYHPHATIAFVQKGSCDHLIDNDFFDKLSDKVDTLHFSAKDGNTHPIYL